MLLHVKFGKIDSENVILQGNFAVSSVPNGFATV